MSLRRWSWRRQNPVSRHNFWAVVKTWGSTGISNPNEKFLSPWRVVKGRVMLCKSAVKSQQAVIIVIDKCSWRICSWGPHSLGHSPWCHSQVIARHMQSISITIPVTWISLFSVKFFCFAQRPTSASQRPSDVIHPTNGLRSISFFFPISSTVSSSSYFILFLFCFRENKPSAWLKVLIFLCSDFRSLVGLNKLYLNEILP